MAKNKVPAPVEATSEEPIITSISLYKVPDMGDDSWVVLEIKSQGNKIISSAPFDTPNMKAIAQEALKIAVVKTFF